MQQFIRLGHQDLLRELLITLWLRPICEATAMKLLADIS
jgi:hypothetical protein